MGLANRLRFTARRFFLSPIIEGRWGYEASILPLTPAHRRLYETIQISYWKKFSRFPNLSSPQDYNECIQWLKLFDQRPEMVTLADKISAKDYVSSLLGAKFIVPTIRVFESAKIVDPDLLPAQFVIKATHDSGSTILVRNKNDVNFERVKQLLQRSLRRKHGLASGEAFYGHIQPRILVEKLIETHDGKPPADYKFHCVNGKVRWLQYIYDRGFNTKEVIVDPEGRVTGLLMDEKFMPGQDFKTPENWDELKKFAEALASGWKYLRVDLYNPEHRIFFGELTYYPKGGFYHSGSLIEFGKFLDFERSTFRQPCF